MIHSEVEFCRLREAMVEELRRRYGVTDDRILAAMTKVPRHAFIPESQRGIASAYGDHPCPIGYGQTISQPYIVAYMTDRMEIQAGERVLEIGAGSGYQAAILAELGAEVYTVEIIQPLAEHARSALGATGYETVHVRHGDGYHGWTEHAPFDVIIVTCAPEEVPPALVAQLGTCGRMILPLGRMTQQLLIMWKEGEQLMRKRDLMVRFVPMIEGKE